MINCRPVSNLPFMGKLLDRCVIDQLMDHIHTNNLMEPLQSAYKLCHSTETALLKLKADILKAMDNQEITCLVLLDLSAAFNMEDHKTLLNRLENHFGIKGMALQWIESYLMNWSQRVVLGDTKTLCQICAKHILYHFYADDQKIYLSFKPGPTGVHSAQDDCILQIERCIEEIRNWMAMNTLKLNDDKNEFIIFGTHQQLKKIDHITIRIGSVPIEHVRNLGFLWTSSAKPLYTSTNFPLHCVISLRISRTLEET